MMNHMKMATVYSQTEHTYDECGERIEGSPTSRSIKIVISLRTGSTQVNENVKTVNSNYVGVTGDKDIVENDKILCGNSLYSVDYVSTNGRKSILFLKEIKQYGNNSN